MPYRRLGMCDFIDARKGITVANMIAQRRYSKPGKPAIDYAALETCLRQVALRATCGVHMPRIGTGLAGGDWAIIEPIIERTLCDCGVAVTVYNLA